MMNSPTIDIIVIGGGGGGMMAAWRAADLGARVMLVEKKGVLGGTYFFSGGSFVAANSKLTARAGTGDSVDQFYEEARRFGQGQNHPELLRKIVDHAGSVFDWFLDRGLELRSEKPGPALAHTETGTWRTYWTQSGGKGYIRILRPLIEAEADKGNLELRLNTVLMELVKDTHRGVTGVRLKNADGSISRHSADHIILAAGGYGANAQMIHHYHPQMTGIVSACPPHADGSVIRSAQSVGAVVVNTDFQESGLIILPSPQGSWRTRALILRHGPPHISGPILVDSAGHRFINEDIPDPILRKNAIAELKDKTAYMMFDQPIKAAMPVCPVLQWDWKRFDRVAASDNNHQIVMADTLDGLAERAGLPSRNLKSTVETWNQAVRNGNDPDFGRQPKQSIDQPPFYAVIGKASITVTMGGLKVDGDSRVLDETDQPIEGLYAIGETAGMGQYMGKGLNSGFGVAAPLIMGKLVAEDLVRRIQNI